MASKTDMAHINKIAGLIQKRKVINKYDLIMLSEISVSLFEKLKPLMEHLYKDKLEYDIKTKNWKWLVVVENN